ncbi:hypothetical protein BDV41DRAFT_399172 [Aspergillus transmontanensis]|uniref:Uncharacterized protein n=1 Tax=Aspergillus transmontanensis TaxID=1034304 RepID=A0A5N6VP15_9EURO|nr:hypothetical protein BDV41DRAFT_399172 [Aspergillus transmontanensis]
MRDRSKWRMILREESKLVLTELSCHICADLTLWDDNHIPYFCKGRLCWISTCLRQSLALYCMYFAICLQFR